MVPNGWELNSVNDLFDTNLGKMLNQEAKIKAPHYRYLGNSDVRWGHFNFTNLKSMYFSEKEKNKFTLKQGDILMCEGGEVGRCSIWNSKNEIVYYQKALHRLRSKGGIVPEYFYNFMCFIAGTKALDDFTTRTSIAHLTQEKLLKIIIKTPPKGEQKKIANILSSWDKAINTTNALIYNRKQHKKALMQQLLAGEKRFSRYKGDWNEVKLSDIANIIMGSSPKSSAYNEIGEGLPLLQGNADIKERKSRPRIHSSEITKECQVGDILLSVRAPVGSVAKSLHHACIGRGIAAITTRMNYSQDFLYQWLLWFEARWERLSQGSTFEAVNSNEIKSIHLIIPCIEEQEEIAAVLINGDKEINLLEQQLADLKQEKKALMQQLLTGKRRVKVDEGEAV